MKMKLSEAIRLGSMLGPQLGGCYLSTEGGVTASCAIGAALLAIGGDEDTCEEDKPEKYFPSLVTPLPYKECEECSSGIQNVREAVFHLNDCPNWTREKIADYIVEQGWDCEAVVDAVDSKPAVGEFVATWS